jgi:DNA-binding NtrC family response regulator
MEGARILIAEDEPIARDNLAHVLRNEGFETVAVENGALAIQELEKREFDLVMADLRMQPVGGMQVLKRVKELHPHTEVIVITGFATVSSALETMQPGPCRKMAPLRESPSPLRSSHCSRAELPDATWR